MMIVIVFGLPGSGKSFFAGRLATVIHADYVSSDSLRMEMFKNRTYSKEEKAAVYHVMLGKMKEAILLNRNIVLDATFHTDETRKPFIQETKDGISFIEVKADENLTKERLKRVRADSEADYKIYKLIQQEWEQLHQPHLILESTDENIDKMLQKAVEYLQWENDKRTDH
jgi:predicted kinase